MAVDNPARPLGAAAGLSTVSFSHLPLRLSAGYGAGMSAAADRIQDLLRPTGEEDLLPVRYPSPRVRVEPKQALAAGAVALALVGGWAFSRHPEPQAPPQWEAAADTAAPAQLVVSVVGEVDNPGLVTLEQGARVADALGTARPRPEADLLALNQAQLLVDGQQILVLPRGAAAPPQGAPPGAAAAGAGAGVSINSAGPAELTTLPGVGAATAAAIVAHREASGPFASVEDLMDVKGIGPAKFEALRDLVTL